ncbi:MAG: MFS transporter [SAR324 cluster bacterium]|nr:MFS transporter [SAR324 cluster bacterium]
MTYFPRSVDQKRATFLLLCSSSLTVMAGATIAPALPSIAANFAGEELLVKLLLTLPALFVALGSPFAGLLVDSWGRRPTLFLGFILYALSGTSGLYLETVNQLLVGRAFLGLSVSLIMTTSVTLVGDYFTGLKRNQFIGWQGGAMAFGGVIFLLSGGLLADLGWRMPFWVYLFSLVLLPLAYFVLPEPNKVEKPIGKNRVPFGLLWPIFLYSFLYYILFYLLPVQVPFYLKTLGEYPDSYGGFALAGMTLTASVVSVNYGKLKAKFSYSQLFAFAGLIASAGYVSIALAENFTHLIFACALAGVGTGLLLPNISAWLVNTAPAEVRGKSIGMNSSFIFLGQFTSPILLKPLMLNYNQATAFLVAGGLLAVSGILFFILNLKPEALKK